MAKITLNDLTNLQNEQSVVNTINNNNSAIEAEIENTLSRDGSTPNEMNANLDMNSYRILNLPVAASDNEPVTLEQMEVALEEFEGVGFSMLTVPTGTVASSDYVPFQDVSDSNVLKKDTVTSLISSAGGLLAPGGSTTDNALVRWNGTTGNAIQNSGWILDDQNRLTNQATNLTKTASITAISKGATTTVTAPGHGFTTNQVIQFYGVGGMIELNYTNDILFFVGATTTDTFVLKTYPGNIDVNSTGYGTYTTGGTVTTGPILPTITAYDPYEILYDGPYPTDVRLAISTQYNNANAGNPYVLNQLSSTIIGTGNGYAVPVWGTGVALKTGSQIGRSWALSGFAAGWNALDNQVLGCEVGVSAGHSAFAITGDYTKTWSLILSNSGYAAGAHGTGYIGLVCSVNGAAPQHGIVWHDFLNPMKTTGYLMTTGYNAGVDGIVTPTLSCAGAFNFLNSTFSDSFIKYGTGATALFSVSPAGLVTAATGGSGGYAIGAAKVLEVNSSLTQLKDPDGTSRIYLGPAASPTSFFDNTTNRFRDRAGTTNILDITANGVQHYIAGSAGTPSIRFQADATSGWYRAAANNWTLSLGGTAMYAFSTSGISFGTAAAVQGTFSSLNAMAAITDPDGNADYLPIYDASNTSGRKILLEEVTSHLPASPGQVAGRYYSGFIGSSTLVLAADTLYACRFEVPKGRTYDRIALNVTATGTATDVRLGIFTCGADGRPGTLIVDGGTVSVGSTGAKEVTISQALDAGYYYAVIVSNGTVTVSAANNVGGFPFNMQMGVAAPTASADSQLTKAFPYAALAGASPFGTPTHSSSFIPVLWVRAA